MRPRKTTKRLPGAFFSAGAEERPGEPVIYLQGRTYLEKIGHRQLSAVVPSLEADAGVQAGMRPIDVLSQLRQWIFFDFKAIVTAFSAYAGVDGDMAGDFT